MPGEIPAAPNLGPTRALALLAILWFTAFTWWLALPAQPGYSFDDREAVIGNPVVMGELPASAAFQRDYWHHVGAAGHFRPLATLALRFDASRTDVQSPEAPRAFRFTNLALHLLVVLGAGIGLVLMERRGGPAFPWFGLALFAVHPASADAVAWISGRTSLLSGLGAAWLLVFMASGRRDSLGALRLFIGSLLGVLVSLLAKEDGTVIAAAAPLLAAALPIPREAGASARLKRGASALAGALIAVGVTAWLRQEALGSPLPSAPSAPFRGMPIVDRTALGLSAWSQGIQHAVMPWVKAPPSLCLEDLIDRSDLGSPMAALLYGAGVRGFGLAGLTSAVLLLAWFVRGQRGAHFSLALSCLAALPLVQLVPAGEIFAPRYLYQPLLLGALWVAAAGRRLGTAWQMAVLLGLASASIFRAAPVYESRESYWQAHLPAHEEDAKVWNALGECSRENGDLEEAVRRFEHSHGLDPSFSRPLANLGAMAAKRGDLDAAEKWLTEAIFEGRAEHSPRANLATVLMRLGRTDEALEFYEDAARLSPGRATYHRGVARASMELGLFAEARAALELAISLAPGDPATRRLQDALSRAEAKAAN